MCDYKTIADRLMTTRLNTCKEKKEEIWLSPITKAPTPTEKSKKKRDNTKTPPKTSITQRLRTDFSWGNDSHPTSVDKPILRDPNLPVKYILVEDVYMLEEVPIWISTTWWVSLLVDQCVPEGTCSQVLRSVRLIRSIWRASKFSVFKIDINCNFVGLLHHPSLLQLV